MCGHALCLIMLNFTLEKQYITTLLPKIYYFHCLCFGIDFLCNLRLADYWNTVFESSQHRPGVFVWHRTVYREPNQAGRKARCDGDHPLGRFRYRVQQKSGYSFTLYTQEPYWQWFCSDTYYELVSLSWSGSHKENIWRPTRTPTVESQTKHRLLFSNALLRKYIALLSSNGRWRPFCF